MEMLINPAELDQVELVPIQEIDVDGFFDKIDILGRDFQVTFFRIMKPLGFAKPVRAPVVRIRHPLASYMPGQLMLQLKAEQARLASQHGWVFPH